MDVGHPGIPGSPTSRETLLGSRQTLAAWVQPCPVYSELCVLLFSWLTTGDLRSELLPEGHCGFLVTPLLFLCCPGCCTPLGSWTTPGKATDMSPHCCHSVCSQGGFSECSRSYSLPTPVPPPPASLLLQIKWRFSQRPSVWTSSPLSAPSVSPQQTHGVSRHTRGEHVLPLFFRNIFQLFAGNVYLEIEPQATTSPPCPLTKSVTNWPRVSQGEQQRTKGCPGRELDCDH